MRPNPLIWISNDHIFKHCIGNRKKYSVFGKQLQSGGHNSERRFTIAKNTIILAKRYSDIPGVKQLFLFRILYEIFGIILVEDQKYSKVLAIIRGCYVGFVNAKE